MSSWILFSLCFVVVSCLPSTNALRDRFQTYDSPRSGQHRGTHNLDRSDTMKSLSSEEMSNYLYDINDREMPSDYSDLSLWALADSDALSRGLYTGKTTEPIDINKSQSDDSSLIYDEDEGASDMPTEKRNSPSLSIVNPLDVLRQRLMLEMATKKMRENQAKIAANDLILKELGKRSVPAGEHQGESKIRTKQNYYSRLQVPGSGVFNV